MGEGGGGDWEGTQDRHAEHPIGLGCRLQGGGPLQGGEEGLSGRVSPSQSNKVSLFSKKQKKSMRQNRVRRVSLVTGDTTKSRGCE